MKKVIAIFTIFSFLIYITSCYSYKNLSSQEKYSKYFGNKKIDVLYIKTKQGKVIEFNKHYPGEISETVVVGLPQLRLTISEADSVIFSEYTIRSVWKNRINYEVIGQDSLGYLFHESDTIRIPHSDIEQLNYKIYSEGKTFLFLIGITGAVIGLAFFSLIIYVMSW